MKQEDIKRAIDAMKFADAPEEEYIEERRISFDSLYSLCIVNDYGEKIDRDKLRGFIYTVSTRRYLTTEDIVQIAATIRGWTEEDIPMLKMVNKIADLARTHIYIVPKGEEDDD